MVWENFWVALALSTETGFLLTLCVLFVHDELERKARKKKRRAEWEAEWDKLWTTLDRAQKKRVGL